MFTTYLQEHLTLFKQLTTLEPAIAKAQALVADACLNNRTVFACGNGGSAADAQHFAAELTGRYVANRRSYAGIALTTDTSALTAIGNDYGYEHVFARQLEGLGKSGDVLIAISTSGNSGNVIKAIEVAKEAGIKTVGLLGRDGGKIAGTTDVDIIIPSDTTARIQEAHIFVLHLLCEALEP